MSLIRDLKNRRVFRAAGIYVAVAWGATEILIAVVDQLSLPQTLARVVVILFVVGFPVSMFLAWVFDVTPDGIRRTEPGTRKSVFTIGLAMTFLVAGTAGLYYFLDYRTDQQVAEQTALVLPLRSIAILPFESADADASSAALAIGIADELLTRLGAIPDLKLTGRASSFSTKLHGLDARTIGQMLGVRNILQGSLRSTGERLRINLSLIDAVSGYQVWAPSEPIDIDREDLYRVSADLAARVVEGMDISIGSDTIKRVTHVRKADPRAYDLYLLGMQKLRDLVGDNTMLAVRYFEEALALEPNFAKAHAGLSFALQNAALFQFVTPDQAIARAREAAKQAIAIDPELPDGYSALVGIDWGFYWNWDSVVKTNTHALALAPNNVDVLSSYATVMAMTGQFDTAVERLRQVAELDPLTVDHKVQVGWVLQWAGRYEEALEQYDYALSIIPDDDTHQLMRSTVHMHTALTLASLGQQEEAAEHAEKSMGLADGDILMSGGHAIIFARLGMRERALELFEQYEVIANDSGYADPITGLYLFVALGDHDRAIDYMERAVDERSPSVMFIPQDRDLDALRKNPRFVALMERTGLTLWAR